jgi:hypothetical protein
VVKVVMEEMEEWVASEMEVWGLVMGLVETSL